MCFRFFFVWTFAASDDIAGVGDSIAKDCSMFVFVFQNEWVVHWAFYFHLRHNGVPYLSQIYTVNFSCGSWFLIFFSARMTAFTLRLCRCYVVSMHAAHSERHCRYRRLMLRRRPNAVMALISCWNILSVDAVQAANEPVTVEIRLPSCITMSQHRHGS